MASGGANGAGSEGGGREAGLAAPLSERLRPDSLEDFLGQGHLAERLQGLMAAESLPNLLFFGPPGCGKSTVAMLLARRAGRAWRRVKTPEAGTARLRRLCQGCAVLVIDELHRFSRDQQEMLAGLARNGELTLLACTTENPTFAVAQELLCLLSVVRLRPLSEIDMLELARRGARALGCQMGDAVLEMLARLAKGDARMLLNLVEYTSRLPGAKDNPSAVGAALPEIMSRFERQLGAHSDYASALVKSMRGSDPDAALYYLACLLEAGEDVRFICRRFIMAASEDVGLADPQALAMAVACQQAVEFMGMPEGFIPLAETCVYLALARKSNSAYRAYLAARREVREQGPQEVPLHLRNAPTALQKSWGYGRGYKYPHNFPGGFVEQNYLPDGLVNSRFYLPSANGEEPRLAQWWRRVKKIRDPE
ncbi:MAG: replication-associated recombination protein A [Desulfovibrio sp.]|nr:replication-associated recombination protein A [Desulfovibrio sp.]